MTKWLSLLRAFFPSWRFFVISGLQPQLEVRVGDSEHALSQWMNCLASIRRSFRLINPQANYLHACHNLLLNFTREISQQSWSDQQLLDSAHYQITHGIVRAQLEEMRVAHTHYQFRICYLDPREQTPPQVTLQSPVYGARP